MRRLSQAPRLLCSPAPFYTSGFIAPRGVRCLSTGNDWGNFAHQYDKLRNNVDIVGYYSAIGSAMLHKTFTKKPFVLLDVAAGPGTLTGKVIAQMEADKYRPHLHSKFIVTDIAKPMVDLAAAHVECLPALREWGTETQFRVMDARHPTLRARSVTHMGVMFGVMFFPERAQTLQELCGLMSDDGTGVFSSWNTMEALGLLRDFGLFLGHHRDDLERQLLASPLTICSDPDDFRAELETAGFRRVQVTAHASVFKLPLGPVTTHTLLNNPAFAQTLPFLAVPDKEGLAQQLGEFLKTSRRWVTKDGSAIPIKTVANIATFSQQQE